MNPLIVVLLVVGFSILRWVVEQVGAAAKKRKEMQEQSVREHEALRTGREQGRSFQEQFAEIPEAQSPESRRAQELADLRRRAAARRRGAPGAENPQSASAQSPRNTQQPNPLEVLLGLPPGATSGTIVPSPPRKQAQTSRKRDEESRRRAQRENAARLQAERQKQAAAAARQAETAARTAAQAKQQPRPSVAIFQNAAPAAGIPAADPASQWKRAFIMSEILSAPVSLRR